MITILCITLVLLTLMVWIVEQKQRKWYEEWKLIMVYVSDWNKKDSELQDLLVDWGKVRFDRIDHDLQQIKTRLHYSREREINLTDKQAISIRKLYKNVLRKGVK
jgi:hypothetical protein